MASKSPVNERYRITIPEADDVARIWAAHQSNLSLSLRILIRKCARELGNEDIAMREMGLPIKRGPGRPRKDLAKLLSGPDVPVPPKPKGLLSGGPVQSAGSLGIEPQKARQEAVRPVEPAPVEAPKEEPAPPGKPKYALEDFVPDAKSQKNAFRMGGQSASVPSAASDMQANILGAMFDDDEEPAEGQAAEAQEGQ